MKLSPANPVLSAPRTWRVSAAVLAVHAGIIALLASGLARPVVTPPAPGQIIMASVVLQTATPTPEAPSPPAATPQPQARARTPVPAAKTPPRPASVAPVSTPQAAPQAQPTPVVTTADPGEQAPVVPPASSSAPATAAPSTATGPAHAIAAPARTPAPSAPAPAAITAPSADARYLANPPPPYPRLSKRLGEQGTVVLRVRINTEGRAEEAAVHSTSGYPRLDEAALETVQRWRYVPGQRNGVPETQWFKVPIRFVLD